VKRLIVPAVVLALAVALALTAYRDPINAWRWSSLMALCR
jgi:hypothetical protein